MADILRERGKLGPYATGEPAAEPADSPVVAEDEPVRKRPRKPLPPVDF